jgi:AcrR family transcriptional regulator
MKETRAPADTRARLLAAAGPLFAARGYHATSIRQVAARARVNVAAAHYHFGSKKALYVAVFRAQFADVRARMQAGGAAVDEAELARLGRPQLERLLAARTTVMLTMLLGPPPGLHGTLMQREMADPTDALPVIVREFVDPMMAELQAILGRLAPGLDAAALDRAACSVVGQALFYRFTMPVVLQRWKRRAYDTALVDALAAHVTTFSLGGLTATAHARRSPRTRHA